MKTIHRSAPAEPKTIPTSLMPWLRVHAPHLQRVLMRLPSGENLITPQALLYGNWPTLPSGGNYMEGWVLLLDAAAKIKLVGRGKFGWEYLYQPAFKLTDLSVANDLKVNETEELTFLIGEAAYTFYCHKDEGGALAEATIIRAT